MSGKNKGVVAHVVNAVENDGGSKPLTCIASYISKPFFREFMANIDQNNLPYYTAVRWLSCGNVLTRFFQLRTEIKIFLNEKNRPLPELENDEWV